MRRYTYSILLGFIALTAISWGNVEAANHYICSSATGSNNGSDWANAWHDFDHVTWTRGDTYYLAGGTYTHSATINPGSGTSVTTLKKATGSDHGTNTGWVASYGTDQALLSEVTIQVQASYVTVDGQVGSWGNLTTYGIRIYYSSDTSGGGMCGVPFAYGPRSHVILKCICLECPTPNLATYGFYFSNAYANRNSYITIQHCATYFVNRPFLLNRATELTVEYCWIERNTLYNHGDALFYDAEGNDVTVNGVVRYNVWKDMSGTGILCICMGGTCRNWEIYGNIFYHDSSWTGYGGYKYGHNKIIGDNDGYGRLFNVKIYNNTVYGITSNAKIGLAGDDGGQYGNGNDISNNIFYDLDSFNIELSPGDSNSIVNNNLYGKIDTNSWTLNSRGSGEISNNTDPFVNSAAFDFHLTSSSSAKDRGKTLSSPYSVDMDGVIRPQGSAWDIGAYEYSTGAPKPPVNLRIIN